MPVPASLSPAILTLVRQGTQDAAMSPPCHCVLSFEGITVVEDVAVAILAKWFVDYDTTNLASTPPRKSQELVADFNRPGENQRTLDPYVFDVDDPVLGIGSSGVHIVEVVVGETAGFDNTSTTLPNRAMKPGYTPAVYRFAVDVRLEQAVGQCPRSPPSQAVPAPGCR